jgi:hypothetical protein
VEILAACIDADHQPFRGAPGKMGYIATITCADIYDDLLVAA